MLCCSLELLKLCRGVKSSNQPSCRSFLAAVSDLFVLLLTSWLLAKDQSLFPQNGMASSSRKRETASSGTGADAHFLSDVIRTADIDCMNIEKRTKFIKAQLDSMSEDQLTRYCRYFGPMHYMLPSLRLPPLLLDH